MGDNIYLGDRNGVRTPMQWSARPQRRLLARQPAAALPAGDHRPRVPLRDGQRRDPAASNPHSLLWWMRRMLALRKRYEAFGRGTLGVPAPREPPACWPSCARERRARAGRGQPLALRPVRRARPVRSSAARRPVELFGQTAFPPIGELPYLLTLGPHAFYWFVPGGPARGGRGRRLRRLGARVHGDRRPRRDRSTGRSRGDARARARAVPADAPLVREQGAQHPVGRRSRDTLPHRGPRAALAARVLIVRVEFGEGEAETYSVPLVLVEGERAERRGDRRAAQHRGPPGGPGRARRAGRGACSTPTSAARCSTRCAGAGA